MHIVFTYYIFKPVCTPPIWMTQFTLICVFGHVFFSNLFANNGRNVFFLQLTNQIHFCTSRNEGVVRPQKMSSGSPQSVAPVPQSLPMSGWPAGTQRPPPLTATTRMMATFLRTTRRERRKPILEKTRGARVLLYGPNLVPAEVTSTKREGERRNPSRDPAAGRSGRHPF